MTYSNIPTIRTVFLVVVMVCAVAAVSMPAAGAAASSERIIDTTTIEPGEQTTVTVRSQLDSEGTGYSFEESFSGPVADAEVTSVTVGDADASTIIETASTNGVVVTLAARDLATTEVAVQYTVTANSSTGTITIADGEASSATAGSSEIAVVANPLRINQSVDVPELSPGETATVTTEIENPRSTVSVTQSFEPAVADATLTGVSRHGESSAGSVDPIVAEADPNGSVTTVEGVELSDTLRLQAELTVPEDATDGTQYTIVGNVTSGAAPQSEATAITNITVVGSPAERYAGADGSVSITDLGAAAGDYAADELSISELATVAAEYAG